jgi:hypothetical protein
MDPDRLQRIAPSAISGPVAQIRPEERMASGSDELPRVTRPWPPKANYPGARIYPVNGELG